MDSAVTGDHRSRLRLAPHSATEPTLRTDAGASAPDDGWSDVMLVGAARRGDHRAFEVLYRRHKEWVVSLAFRFTGDEDLAFDVLQETMAYLLKRLPSLELSAKLTTFLYPAVRHTSITLARKRRRALGVGAPDAEASAPPEPSSAFASSESHGPLRRAIAELPPAQAEVLLMRYASDMSEADIAGALGIPKGTVKSRLHHAIRKLKELGVG